MQVDYTYAASVEESRFFRGLAQGRILGQRCPACTKVYVPPRQVCGPCYTEMTELVPVASEGKIVSFTILRFQFLDPETGEILPRTDADPVQRGAVIKVGGASTTEEDEDEGDAIKPLPERLVIELTAHRTLALRDAVANNPRIAMTALLHKLVLDCFDGRVTGTFGTETGDYRYLDGIMHGDSLLLSAFDGSHAFLFQAALRGDSLLGRFRSGIHSQEPWYAIRNEAFHLRDPDSLTFLKEGHEMVALRLPDLDGRSISPMDDPYKGHVRMVQVMGSWCPNCVDETVLLTELYDQYHQQGLDVFAVAFERYPEKDKAIASLKRFKDRLRVKYDVLYGGESRKEVASEKLPFLDHIMSYPTCIFIDRAGKVRRIRTGFYGPGTGEHYLNYKRNLKAFIEKMLAEPVEGRDPS